MVSNFSSKFIRRGGYSFDEATIGTLVQRSSQFAGMDVDVEVTFEDGQSIATSNFQDLLEDSYVKGSVIKQLVIRAWNMTKAPELAHVMIILNTIGSEGVSVVLKADRQSSTITRSEIQNLIDARRQWYSWLFPSPGWLLFLYVIWYGSVAVISGMLVGLSMPGQVSVALWVHSLVALR